jgi:chromosome segregation ATPase
MEEADVLLGITMEEQGVSKVVTLNLNKKAG